MRSTYQLGMIESSNESGDCTLTRRSLMDRSSPTTVAVILREGILEKDMDLHEMLQPAETRPYMCKALYGPRWDSYANLLRHGESTRTRDARVCRERRSRCISLVQTIQAVRHGRYALRYAINRVHKACSLRLLRLRRHSELYDKISQADRVMRITGESAEELACDWDWVYVL